MTDDKHISRPPPRFNPNRPPDVLVRAAVKAATGIVKGELILGVKALDFFRPNPDRAPPPQPFPSGYR
jgi:hypothetical protein